jgi:hypothetical protein
LGKKGLWIIIENIWLHIVPRRTGQEAKAPLPDPTQKYGPANHNLKEMMRPLENPLSSVRAKKPPHMQCRQKSMKPKKEAIPLILPQNKPQARLLLKPVKSQEDSAVF